MSAAPVTKQVFMVVNWTQNNGLVSFVFPFIYLIWIEDFKSVS